MLREGEPRIDTQPARPYVVFTVPYNKQYHAVCALVPVGNGGIWPPTTGKIGELPESHPLRSPLSVVLQQVRAGTLSGVYECTEPEPYRLGNSVQFRARCQLYHSLQQLGSLQDEQHLHECVVAKTIYHYETNPLVEWTVQREAVAVPGGLRARPGDPIVLDAHEMVPTCNVEQNLRYLQAHASTIPNVVPVLHVEVYPHVDALIVYSPWCDGGNVTNAVKRFGVAVARRILAGALTGLHALNTTLKLLHYNINPRTILVAGCPRPVGVIGELHTVIRIPDCQPLQHRILGDPCYGAPFQHCDPRRDQVAFLLTLVEVLSGVCWSERCESVAAEQNQDPRYWGWAATDRNTPGRSPRFWPTALYQAYGETVSMDVGGQNVPHAARFRQNGPDDAVRPDTVGDVGTGRGCATPAARGRAGTTHGRAEPGLAVRGDTHCPAERAFRIGRSPGHAVERRLAADTGSAGFGFGFGFIW